MAQRDHGTRAAAWVLFAAGALPGCYTAQLVRTDTIVTYDLIEAPTAPPPVPADAVVAAPSSPPSGMIWMEPYWQWYGGQYAWVVGRWIPVLAGYTFVQPRWHAVRDRWAMSGGGWADPSGRVVATPPPASTRFGARQCGDVSPQASTAAPVVAPPVVADVDVAPGPPAAPAPSGLPVRRTVTLGHLYYGSARRDRDDHDDDAPRASRADASSTPSASPGPSSSSPRITTSPRTTPTHASSSSGSSSTTSDSSSSSRTGYPTSSSSAAPSSSGSTSFGSRTGYASPDPSTGSGTRSVRP